MKNLFCFVLRTLAAAMTVSCCSVSYAQDHLIEGFVTNAQTNERIPSAIVSLNGAAKTFSDRKGYFSIQVDTGSFFIEVRSIGFVALAKHTLVKREDKFIQLFFDLVTQTIQLDSVFVEGQTGVLGPGAISMTAAQIQTLPQFAEADPIRAVQTLPGITTATSDFNAHLFLRGGNFDETGILLDDVPLYNAFHFAGWITPLNADIVKNVTVYRSHYPLKYGGFLSGIVETTSKSGSRDQFKGSAGVSLSTIKSYVEIPFTIGSVIAAARRTYWDAVVNTVSGSDVPFFFYDLYLKASAQLGLKHRLQLSTLFSKDQFDLFASRYGTNEPNEPHWSNRMGTMEYSFLPHSALALRAQAYVTQSLASSLTVYQAGLSSSPEFRKAIIDNSILEVALKLEGELSFTNGFFVFGVSARTQNLRYMWDIKWDSFNDVEELLFPKPASFFDYAPDQFEYESLADLNAFFVRGDYRIIEKIKLSLGYRLERFNPGRMFFHSPSVSISYLASPSLSLALSYGRYYQHLYTLKERKNDENMFSPYAVYFVARNREEVGTSDNLTATLRLEHFPTDVSLEIAGYYLIRQNLSSTYDISDDYNSFETGKSIGVDMTASWKAGSFSGWFTYSLARSTKRNSSFVYPTNSDRTHTLKLIAGGNLLEWLNLDVGWMIASGVPHYPIIGKYAAPSSRQSGLSDPFLLEWRPIAGQKNSDRTNAYHRLDVGATGRFIWGRFLIKPYLQVFNVYNSPNPSFENWGKVDQRASSILPTIGVNVEF